MHPFVKIKRLDKINRRLKPIIFILLFAIIGTVLIFATQAATSTQTFNGKLSAGQPSQSYAINAEPGQLNATLSVKGRANIKLTMTDQAGAVIATKSGITSVSISAPTAAGKYNLVVTTLDKLTAKGLAFTLQATYPTVDVTSPSVPTNVTAKAASSSEVDLAWTASTDNTEVVGYDIYRDGVIVGTTGATTYKDSGLTSSTTYSYAVKAKDAAGNISQPSPAVTVKTAVAVGDVTPPSTPTNLIAKAASNNQIDLQWTASTDNVGVTGYDIYYSNGTLRISNTTDTSYSDTGSGLNSLTPGTTYSYYIKAKDAAGNASPASTTVSATTTNYPADYEWPTAPTNVTATASSATEVSITWTAGTDNMGIQSYKIYRYASGLSDGYLATVGPTELNYVDSSASPNTEYRYAVETVDFADHSRRSSLIPVTTPGAVSAMISAPASGSTQAGVITVSGTASSIRGEVSKVEVAGSYGNYQLATGTANWTATVDTTKMLDSAAQSVNNSSDPISRFIFVKVTDTGGDFKIINMPIIVKNDTSPPTVTITSPTSGSTQNGFYAISGTASDNAAVTRVVLTSSSGSGGAIEATGTTNWTAAATTKTSYSFNGIDTVTAYDANGNKSVARFSVNDGGSTFSGIISGKTYQDLNKNGVYDSGDQIFTNHRIYLYADTGGPFGQYLKSTTSDADGNYRFTDLQDGNYRLVYADYNSVQANWTPVQPTVKISFNKASQTVQLRGSATSDFVWRVIGRTPDPNSQYTYQMIASVTGTNGLTARQYDDVIAAQEILNRASAGKLIGAEASSTVVSEGYRLGGGFAGTTSAGHSTDNVSGRCSDPNGASGVYWPYWYDDDEGVLFHEYGHSWQNYWSCLRQDIKLNEYMRIRGLDLTDPRINTNHEWSLNEIAAEDYSQLFSAKSISESQENRFIPRATEIPGFKDYLINTYRTSR